MEPNACQPPATRMRMRQSHLSAPASKTQAMAFGILNAGH